MTKPIRILNIAATPFELYLLTATLLLWRKTNPNIQADLIVSKKLLVDFQPAKVIENQYTHIFKADLAGLTPSSKKVWQNIKKGLILRKYFKNFNFQYHKVCINSYNEFFANVLYRHLPKNIHLLIFTPYANYISRTTIPAVKKKYLLDITLRLCDWLFGFAQTKQKWSPETGRSIFRNISKLPPHQLIILGEEKFKPNISDKATLLPYPFPALKKLFPQQKSQEKAIYINGERTPYHPSWAHDDQKRLEEFFDYLRNNFSDYKFYFRPRAGFTNMGELESLLKGFQIIDTPEPLEELFARKKFDKIISFKSTVSKIATFYGIPGYVLYPMFNMPENFRISMADNIFSDAPQVIKMKKFEDIKLSPKLEESQELTKKFAIVL